jgi:hypothetical protein
LHQIPSKLHLLFYQCFGPGCFLSRGLFVQAFYACLQPQSDEQYKKQYKHARTVHTVCTRINLTRGFIWIFLCSLFNTASSAARPGFNLHGEKRLCTLLFLLGPGRQGSCSLHSSVCSPCPLQS